MDLKLKETVVIDHIVDKWIQDKIENLVLNQQSWRFVNDMSYAKNNLKYPSYGFNCLYKHPELGIVSNLYEAICVPIVNKLMDQFELNIKDIYFCRSFLQLPLDSKFVKEHNGVHVDADIDHYACVYYVNDSDGDTIIYDQTKHDVNFGSSNVKLTEHKRVTPKKGRVVLFDGSRYHCSSQPKDNLRCIINFDLI